MEKDYHCRRTFKAGAHHAQRASFLGKLIIATIVSAWIGMPDGTVAQTSAEEQAPSLSEIQAGGETRKRPAQAPASATESAPAPQVEPAPAASSEPVPQAEVLPATASAPAPAAAPARTRRASYTSAPATSTESAPNVEPISYAEPIPTSTTDNVGPAGGQVAPITLLTPATSGKPGTMYYPTTADYQYLGPGTAVPLDPGPEHRKVAEGALWSPGVPESYDDPFTRFSRPIDPYLDVLTPGEFFGIEGDDPLYVDRLSLSSGVGKVFTRNYRPTGMLLKAGPIYFDFRSASINLLYDSYDNQVSSRSAHGWIFIADVSIRMLAQVTDSFYIAVQASAYITSSGRLGFSFLNGGPIFLQAAYEKDIGDWHIVLYDRAQILQQFLQAFDQGSYDSVGSYNFGRPGDTIRASSVYEGVGNYFMNRAGIAAARPLFDDTFKLSLGVQRLDSWELDGFDYFVNVTRLWTRLAYVNNYWVHPYAEYYMSGTDNFNRIAHVAYLGARARINRDLMVFGRVGYLSNLGSEGSSKNSVLALGNITHRLGPYTWHFLQGGTDYINDIYGEGYLTTFGQYRLTQRIANGVQVYGSVLGGTITDQDGQTNLGRFLLQFQAGLFWHLTPSDDFSARYLYQDVNYQDQPIDQRRNVIQATLRHRFSPELYGSILYQFERSDSQRDVLNYYENLMMLRLTYLF